MGTKYLLIYHQQACILVHGGWSEFGNWTNCDKPCDGGSKWSKRRCDNPEPAFGGKTCEGSDTINETCNVQMCKREWFSDNLLSSILSSLAHLFNFI